MKNNKSHMKFEPELDIFKIRINDGFCEWEFPLIANDQTSIANITEILYKHFNENIDHGKCISIII